MHEYTASFTAFVTAILTIEKIITWLHKKSLHSYENP